MTASGCELSVTGSSNVTPTMRIVVLPSVTTHPGSTTCGRCGPTCPLIAPVDTATPFSHVPFVLPRSVSVSVTPSSLHRVSGTVYRNAAPDVYRACRLQWRDDTSLSRGRCRLWRSLPGGHRPITTGADTYSRPLVTGLLPDDRCRGTFVNGVASDTVMPAWGPLVTSTPNTPTFMPLVVPLRNSAHARSCVEHTAMKHGGAGQWFSVERRR